MDSNISPEEVNRPSDQACGEPPPFTYCKMLAKGYHVIPQKVYGTSPCHRLLYLKEHGGVYKTAGAGGEDEDGDVQGHTFGKGKTLFVGNVDDQGPRIPLQLMLGVALKASLVLELRAKQPSLFEGSNFASTKGVKNALALTYATSVAPDCNIAAGKEVDEDRDSDGNATCGYAALRQRHRALFPSRKRLQEDVDSRMEEFDRNVAVQESERDKLAAQGEDDDGFVTVTYKKNKRGRMTGGTGARLQQVGEENERVKKKRKGAEGLPDFYRFQMREARREQLSRLRRKFDEDKARVARMKEQRKFKPF